MALSLLYLAHTHLGGTMNIIKSKLFILAMATSLMTINAFAHDRNEHDQRRENEDEMNRVLKERVEKYRPQPSQIKIPKRPGPLTTITCGDTITQSITVANDINCSTTGFALRVVGDNITVNGNGHKIIAPLASAGLYVQGLNDIVSSFDIQGISGGYGIMGYNSSSLKVISNNLSNNMIGLMIYTDRGETASPVVMMNKAQSNSFAAVRTYSDDPGTITHPIIRKNDFRLSGQYALYIKAENFEISGDDANNLSGSTNGYYLKSGDFRVTDLSMAKQLITKRIFFVDSARTILFKNVDVSTLSPLTLSQERMGIDLYKVASFELINVIAKNNDVGLKLETEGGVNPSGTLTNCTFGNQSLSGIYIVSYDETAYGIIRILSGANNLLSVGKVIISSGTIATVTQEAIKCLDREDDSRDSHCDQNRDEREDKDDRDERENDR
jgi:hypothetical protein